MKKFLFLLALVVSSWSRAVIVPSNVTYTAQTSQDVDTAKNMLWMQGPDGKLHQAHSSNTGDLITAPGDTATPTITPTVTPVTATLTPTLTLTPAQVAPITVTGTVTPPQVFTVHECITVIATCQAGANTPCPTIALTPGFSYQGFWVSSNSLTPIATAVIFVQSSPDGVGYNGGTALTISGTQAGGGPVSSVQQNLNSSLPFIRYVPTVITSNAVFEMVVIDCR